jgi:dolichyl-diphosphooligosaccharide--protein glycosyltransferase
MGRRAGFVALLAVLALALAARSLGSDLVFLDDGSVVFTSGDPWYHMRRALFSFAHFPDYLTFDRCLAHPHGSPVPWPPLWDLAVAAVGHLAGGTRRSFELAGAWLPVVVGAATVFPVHAIGRRLAGRGVGLGAAAIYALLPAGIEFARVGYADHHAAVALLGACLLALYCAVLDGGTTGRALARAAALLAATRAAMLLVWPGTLLYLAPGELALALAAIVPGRRDRLAALAASAAASFAIVVPFVLHAARPLGGPFSATEISWLHVAALAAMTLVLGAVRLAMDRGFAGRAPTRLGVAAGSAIALVALGLLVVPGLAGGLGGALGFVVSGTDAIGKGTPELSPFLSPLRGTPLAAATRRMGLFFLLVPVVPLAFLSLRRDPDKRAAAWLLAGWTAFFAVLTAKHMRYMNDYAPAASVGFALVLAIARRWVAARIGEAAATGLAIAVGAAAIAPAIVQYHLPYLEIDRAALPGDRALYTLEGTQMRFAEAVRAQTPASPGCGEDAGRPAYGVLAHPAIGHALHYVAERATPADPFGPYIGAATFAEALRFFATSSEDEAVAIARALDAPYVVTTHDVGQKPDSLLSRLHVGDGGSAGNAPPWGRFRLLAEGPAGGRSLVTAFGLTPETAIPFKLYEIVDGAVLEARAAPGSRVRAQLAIQTPLRRFGWEAVAVAGPDGVARLRVPYATEGDGPVHAAGLYRVHVGDRTVKIGVTDEQVRSGAVVPVGDD